MPVYSMTGYASATTGAQSATQSTPEGTAGSENTAHMHGASVMVELRSVNGRFLDLGFRLPDEFRALEPALRDVLGRAFRRGKIELRLSTLRELDSAWPSPQPDQLSRLGRLENTVHSWLPKAQPLSVHEVLQWCKGAHPLEKIDEVVLQATRQAVDRLIEARAREGHSIVAMLTERMVRLHALVALAEPLVPAAVQRQQQRFIERWQEAMALTGAPQNLPQEALQERALNEAAAYAIRIDVAEELNRLSAHLKEFQRLLKAGGEVGKRLDFLIQELLREANTLGSKASSLELTNVALEMKVLIEQLREQVQNLE
jgi:uncharacterized protein (TIGR00255 family)